MEVLVVRHAIAEDRETFARTGADDAERPLTRDGRRKFEKAARGLVRLVGDVDVLATSRLVRATQTAAILQREYGAEPVLLDALEPDADPPELVRWLARQKGGGVVAVVGHEPHLSSLVEVLLTGKRASFVELKKGGACLVGFDDAPAAGKGQLRWLLTAGQLRRLAR